MQITSPDVSVARVDLLFELCNLSVITLFVHDDSICFILGAHVNQMKLINVISYWQILQGSSLLCRLDFKPQHTHPEKYQHKIHWQLINRRY